MGSPAETDFWTYSLSVYARPGVEQACISLQDRCNLDVNLVLFCCWSAYVGYGTLSAEERSAALRVSAFWNGEVVAGLRAVRRVLKTPPDIVPRAISEPLRRRVKRLELSAEKREQALLQGLLHRPHNEARSRAAAEANLSVYLSAMQILPGPQEHSELDVVLAAAFPL
jgi:uncharacterized protein (TIGR02444 family)